MAIKESETQIGFSVFDPYEECYQYNEDACFIAATREDAEEFLKDSFLLIDPAACRIDAIKFSDIMADYGASNGEYAMERDAFSRFRAVAEANGVGFSAEPYDGDDSLMVVQVDGVLP